MTYEQIPHLAEQGNETTKQGNSVCQQRSPCEHQRILHDVRNRSESRLLLTGPQGRRSADTVAKLFCAPECATLIQEGRPMSNIDSKILSSRFDCCAPAACRRVLQQYLPIAEVWQYGDLATTRAALQRLLGGAGTLGVNAYEVRTAFPGGVRR